MSLPTRYRLAVAAIAVIAMFAGAFWAQQSLMNTPPPTNTNTTATTATLGGPFVLRDGNGETVTETIFADLPYAILFGFTHCPDICPSSLARLQTWQQMLGNRAQAMRFAFVTVDPERDSAEKLAVYVRQFSPSIIALSGTPEQIQQMLMAYRVYASKVPLPNGGYMMDHHSAVFLFDAKQRFVESIYYDDNQQTALAKLERLLDS